MVTAASRLEAGSTEAESDLALYAHLMRRAGFGATRDELEELAGRGYGAVVDDLLHPERFPEVDEDILRRYFPSLVHHDTPATWNARWMYRMINSKRPLEEKLALFWHGLFATGWDKSEHTPSSISQIEMFRRNALAPLRTILIELSKDPAMIYWLDNSENHRDAPNENYGRELMELFSMGLGNYTETDVKMAARAFTGWTVTQPIPIYPYGYYPTQFVYRPEDHDDSEKTFLGETGRFNGEEIVDIIARQPCTARFIARHLYNYFVADEPQVPAWNILPPADPEAVDTLVETYFASDGSTREMLRVLFNADFFKEAQAKRIKSPIELVVGTIKLSGTHRFPEPGLLALPGAAGLMGQRMMNPPTVEGWHTGKEWIDGGTLVERVNFAVNEVADTSKPGIQVIVNRLNAAAKPLSPVEFVDACLDLCGPLRAGAETRAGLLRFAESGGDLDFATSEQRQQSTARVGRMVQLIVASREYQFA
ncbi:MAG: DUF1800 domain-containing protein [Dehalococcoidia bacterium]